MKNNNVASAGEQLIPEDKKNLDELLLQKITKVLENNRTFDAICQVALHGWVEFNENEAREWVHQTIKDSDKLINFLDFLKFYVKPYPIGSPSVDEDLFHYVDRDFIVARLKTLNPDSLDDKQQLLVQLFLYIVEKNGVVQS